MGVDLRLRDFLNSLEEERSIVHLIEFPCDKGVTLNGGRDGAAKAPDLIRAALFNMTPHTSYYEKHTNLLEKVLDTGHIPCTGDVENNQDLLAKAVAKKLNKGKIPVIIGGGHETAFGHFLGYAQAKKDVTIINIDAHTDVRPLKDGKPHSGSPFRQALEHSSSVCKAYHVFGLNPATVAFKHYNFVKQNGGTAHFAQELSKNTILRHLEDAKHNIMITMDMDAVDQSEAPGVSAPNASGLSKDMWLDLAFEFGRNEKVTSFDLCEVNPVYDRDNQTVRLAAITIWYFLLGLSLRGRLIV